MSVIVTLRFVADAAKVEEFAAENEEHMKGIVEAAKGHGLVAHRFYGTDDGKLMVVDEWPDAESFQTFFAEQESEIEPIMQAAGVTAEPEIVFWRKLDSRDDVGWD